MEIEEPMTCVPGSVDGGGRGNDSTSEAAAGVDDGATEAKLALMMDVTYHYIFPVLITAAVVTNVMNLVALVKARGSRDTSPALAATYRYLMWLSATDLLAAVSLVPAIMYLERAVLPYGWAFYYAHLDIPIMNGLTSASVYIVVGLSVDRYVAVCHPRRYQAVSAPRTAALRVALSLTVPALLYLPHCFLYQEVVCAASGREWTYQGGEGLGKAWKVWVVVVELCHRLLPALILFLLNTALSCALLRLAARRWGLQGKATVGSRNSGGGEDRARQQQERRLVHLLLAVVVTFLLTNLPAAILAVSDTAGHTFGSFQHEVFRSVANCLEVLGFSLNFFLYFTMMPGLREALRAVGRSCGLVVGGMRSPRDCTLSDDQGSKITQSVEL